MKNILKLAAALFVLSSSASVLAISGPVSVDQPSQPTTMKIKIIDMLVSSVVGTARFTPPEFCYVGKIKVACTFTNAPSKDPTRP